MEELHKLPKALLHDHLDGGLRVGTILDLAAEIGVPAEAADLPPEALREADEAFICSTAGGIMPVGRVDDRVFGNGGPGPISTRLRELYWRKREAGWLGTPIAELLGDDAVAQTA